MYIMCVVLKGKRDRHASAEPAFPPAGHAVAPDDGALPPECCASSSETRCSRRLSSR